MFTWLTKRLRSSSAMRRRRKAVRRKSAPVINAIPSERIKKVTDKPEWKKMHEVRAIRAGMLAVIFAITAVLVIAGAVIWNMVQKADTLEWAWLNEFLGKTESSEASSPSSGSEESLPEESEDFRLLLVNADHPFTEKPSLTAFAGVEVDARITEDLSAMLEAAEAEGISLSVISGYVSVEAQEEAYLAKVQELMAAGSTRVSAETQAAALKGGCSEYHTGLTVRLAASSGGSGAFTGTEAYRWLMQNSVQYGFVFRYPENKTRQTGMEFDPQALRYVGKEHAARMRQMEMCLEEYVDYLSAR